MVNGNSTSKKFGGISDTDPDWFLLTIKGYRYGYPTDSVQVYLADFRSDTPSQDYILKDWQWVDLSHFGVDSLSFSLSSSETDSNGLMRPPAYFCLDDIKSIWPTGGGIHEVYQNGLFKIYPNPAASGGQLFFDPSKQTFSRQDYIVSLYNLPGKKVMQRKPSLQKSLILPQLSPGIFTLRICNERQETIYSQKLMVQ